MNKTFLNNLWVTRIFFLVRFAASVLVGFMYIMLAALIQYLYVSWFGETTFNYIVGGALSLYLGVVFCHYVGAIAFMFVRGWHMAALAKVNTIKKRNLPVLDTGMFVFKTHFTSFAAVYGASAIIKKVIDEGDEQVWGLLKDVPYIGTLSKFTKNPIVQYIARDLMDTAFDATIFYLVKYTKPGIADDMEGIRCAMRKYLYALPDVLLTSISSFLVLNFLPQLCKWIVALYVLFTQGLVAGILINVLLFPLFYIIKHSVFDPLDTIMFVSSYAKHCTAAASDEEVNGSEERKTVVDAILDLIGLSDFISSADNEMESEDEGTGEGSKSTVVDEKSSAKKDTPKTCDGDLVEEAEECINMCDIPLDDDPILNVKPVFEEDIVQKPKPESNQKQMSLADLANIATTRSVDANPAALSSISAMYRSDVSESELLKDASVTSGEEGEEKDSSFTNLDLFSQINGSSFATKQTNEDSYMPQTAKLSALLSNVDTSQLGVAYEDEQKNILAGDEIDIL